MTAGAHDHVASSGRPLPGPFLAAFLYAARVSVPPKKALLLLLPCLGAVLFGLLSRTSEEPLATARFADFSQPIFAVVLPLACLIVGDAVLGAEVRSGTFALTWLSPAPFPAIVLARWLAGWVITGGALALAFTLAALAAGAPDAVGAMAVVAVAASAAYVAVFVFIGAATQRAALWSLGFVLLVERLLGAVLAGIAQLSPQWLATTAYARIGPDAAFLARSGVPSGWGAIGRLGLVTVLCLALALWRVRHLRLAGVSD